MLLILLLVLILYRLLRVLLKFREISLTALPWVLTTCVISAGDTPCEESAVRRKSSTRLYSKESKKFYDQFKLC